MSGQPEDTTGLTYLNNRYHDPQLAAFISVDPLVGKTGHPYLYASGSPATRSDPSELDDGFNLIGAIGEWQSAMSGSGQGTSFNPIYVGEFGPGDELAAQNIANDCARTDAQRCIDLGAAGNPSYEMFAKIAANLIANGHAYIDENGRLVATIPDLDLYFSGWVDPDRDGMIMLDAVFRVRAKPDSGGFFKSVLKVGLALTTIISGASCPLTGAGCVLSVWSGGALLGIDAYDAYQACFNEKGSCSASLAAVAVDVVTLGAGRLMKESAAAYLALDKIEDLPDLWVTGINAANGFVNTWGTGPTQEIIARTGGSCSWCVVGSPSVDLRAYTFTYSAYTT